MITRWYYYRRHTVDYWIASERNVPYIYRISWRSVRMWCHHLSEIYKLKLTNWWVCSLLFIHPNCSSTRTRVQGEVALNLIAINITSITTDGMVMSGVWESVKCCLFMSRLKTDCKQGFWSCHTFLSHDTMLTNCKTSMGHGVGFITFHPT